jgi:hypothetical protein
MNSLDYYIQKSKDKFDKLDADYNGKFYGMSKQDAIECLTLTLFEAFDVYSEETPNPNPHPIQIQQFINKVQDILNEKDKPYMFVSPHSFKVWFDRKNGIIKDYWSY